MNKLLTLSLTVISALAFYGASQIRLQSPIVTEPKHQVVGQLAPLPEFKLASTQKDKFWMQLHNEIDAVEGK